MKTRFFCIVSLPSVVTVEIEMEGGGIISADVSPVSLKAYLLASDSFFTNKGDPVNGWQELQLTKSESVRL